MTVLFDELGRKLTERSEKQVWIKSRGFVELFDQGDAVIIYHLSKAIGTCVHSEHVCIVKQVKKKNPVRDKL